MNFVSMETKTNEQRSSASSQLNQEVLEIVNVTIDLQANRDKISPNSTGAYTRKNKNKHCF